MRARLRLAWERSKRAYKRWALRKDWVRALHLVVVLAVLSLGALVHEHVWKPLGLAIAVPALVAVLLMLFGARWPWGGGVGGNGGGDGGGG